MPPETPQPPPNRFFGLDPARTLGVLEAGTETPPAIAGWTISGIAGRGGFGTVWRAHRESDGAIAAVKIASADDPDTLERIEEETGALRALNHPHIVALLDSGPLDDPEGGLFLAMEFIDGPELSHEIPDGGLPLEMAFDWFRQIGSAVSHAHDAGILHRDLKPANILIDAGGQIKVADFGLALPVHRRVHQLSLTRAGMVAGTAEYLPPEAYLPGYRPSAATDIFALGVILHEMLAGTPPRGAWPPVSNKRRVDVRIDALIRRALDPDPRHRWQSVRDMCDAFEEIANSPPRYAGAPLVTFPVRFADLLWTLTGLFALTASASSLLHLQKSSFSLPFDLIGKHSDLVGGYHAVFILLQPAFVLGLWQALRLWRFRHVPMREALPSPFGLRLGHGKVAAAQVTLCQLFCLWLPAMQILAIFFDSCSDWLRTDDPAWRHGLAVVSWQDGTLANPWTYPAPGTGFWLQERYGPPGHALSRFVDRIGFTPLLFPLMMSLGGLSLLFAMCTTLFVAVRTWWLRNHRVQPALVILLAIGTSSVLAKPAAGFLSPPPPAELMRRDSRWVDHQMTAHLRLFAEFLLGARKELSLRGPFTHWTGYYAETLNYRGQNMTSRHDVERLWREAATRASNIQVSILHIDHRWSAKDDSFAILARAVETCDGREPDGAKAAVECILHLNGTLTQQGITTISEESFQRVPLYQTEMGPIRIEDATAWARSLDHAARQAGSDPTASAAALENLFLPLPFTSNRKLGAWLQTVPSPESGLIAQLRQDLRTNGPEDVVLSEVLPGGRTRVRLRLSHSPAEPPRWLSADLIRHSGTVKCVRLSI